MQKYLLRVVGGVGVLAASSFLLNSTPVVAQTHEYPVYDSAGRVQVPTGYRAWVFLFYIYMMIFGEVRPGAARWFVAVVLSIVETLGS